MFVSGPVLYRVPAFALARSSDLRLVRFQKERPGVCRAFCRRSFLLRVSPVGLQRNILPSRVLTSQRLDLDFDLAGGCCPESSRAAWTASFLNSSSGAFTVLPRYTRA